MGEAVDKRKLLTSALALAGASALYSFGEAARAAAPAIPPGIPLSPANSVPGFRNWDRANLRKAIAALAKVRSNTGSMTINVAGHSALMGEGSGTTSGAGALTGGAQPFSVASVLSKHLNACPRLRARLASVNSALKTPSRADFAAYDSRCTLTSDWTFATGDAGVGTGGYLFMNSSGTGAFSITPTAPDGSSMVWDSARVWYGVNAGLGTFTLDIGGTVYATQSTAGSIGLGSVSIGPGNSVPRTAQTLNIKRTTGGAVYPAMIEFWDSTVNDIRVRGLGWSGSQASDWISNTFPYHAFSALPVMGGDLTIFECFRNDQSHAVAPTTWQANFDACVAQWRTFGDVIIIVDHEPYTWTLTNDAQFRAGLQTISDKYSVPLVDIRYLMGSGPQGWAAGYGASDNVHYSATGWDVKGGILAEAISEL